MDAQVSTGLISKEEGKTLKAITFAAAKDQNVRDNIDTCDKSGSSCSLSINDQIIKLDPKQVQHASDTIVVADLKGFLKACYMVACAYLGEEPPPPVVIDPPAIERPAGSPGRGPKPKPSGPGPKTIKPL